MKKIKICILILVMILMSGCSCVYNITINEDLTVTEDVVLSVDNNEGTFEKINSMIQEYGISKDDYSLEAKSHNIQVKFKKTFISIEDYILNSKMYSQLFDGIKYSNDDRTITLNAESVFDLNNTSENVVNSMNLELLNINLSTPLRVTSDNADEVNDNVYTWTINPTDNSKKISIEIGTSAVSNLYKPIIIIGLVLGIIVGFSIYAFINYKKGKKI